MFVWRSPQFALRLPNVPFSLKSKTCKTRVKVFSSYQTTSALSIPLIFSQLGDEQILHPGISNDPQETR